MLIDTVKIVVKAGNGGNGGSTLSRTAQTSKGGPDGGNGGNGGSVWVQGQANLNDLRFFRYKKKITADDGIAGSKNNMYGRNASDIVASVPIGTLITDLETGKTIDIVDSSKHLLCVGGKGGRGNVEFKTATNQTPRHGEKGGAGQIKKILFNLRLIAEVGLIGLPNAGKSSLLRVLTNATPTVGNYPFTTLEANIGMLGIHPIADIPGLIEGASKGKGLGTKFLKHIEKTKILVHCVDVSQENPIASYDMIRHEFELFSSELPKRPEIILLTKIDLAQEGVAEKYQRLFEKRGLKVYACSIYDLRSIDVFKEALGKIIS